MRTRALPALRYGAGVVGVGKATLRAARSFACAVRGEMRGRCTFARLALARSDPGLVLATDPLLEWACAAWDGSSCEEDMAVVWRAAVQLAGTVDRPFQAVKGPAGAMVASEGRSVGKSLPLSCSSTDRMSYSTCGKSARRWVVRTRPRT